MSKELTRDELMKAALTAFVDQQNYTYGDTIRHEWFREQFNLPEPPKDGDMVLYGDVKDAQLNYTELLIEFRQRLLTEHLMVLRSKIGEGYVVLHPNEQTFQAMRQFAKKVTNALRRAARELENIRVQELDPDIKAQNERARERISWMAQHHRRRKIA